MEELIGVLQQMISEQLYQVILSNPRSRDKVSKVKVRPVIIKEALIFQETVYRGTQVFHENRTKEEMIDRILYNLTKEFKQCEIVTQECKVTVLFSKRGKITIKKHDNSSHMEELRQDLSHNRVKKYILEEGKPIPFLIDLGVMTKEGKVIRSKYDKFKQINRYLEFIQDIMPTLPRGRTINIIDFGCGKSYLTFALYYYLHDMNGLPVHVVGLDLKKEVISRCNGLAERYGYEFLEFLQGDIAEFEIRKHFSEDECQNKRGSIHVDMVVTLHACDTATDYALSKAVEWGANVILSVPCCQHEVNDQIICEPLAPILKYGLIRERMSALLTDAIRANLLEEQGYETKILEFINMEHTPKNILIRAVKKNNSESKEVTNISGVTDFFHIETTLQKLLK